MKTNLISGVKKLLSKVSIFLIIIQILSPYNNLVAGVGSPSFTSSEIQANISEGVDDQTNISDTPTPNEVEGVDDQTNISDTPTPNVIGVYATGSTSLADGSNVVSSDIGTSSNGVIITITDDDATDCSTLSTLGGSFPTFTLTCDLDNSVGTGVTLSAGTMTSLIDGDANFSATVKGGSENTVLPDTITLSGGVDAEAQVSTVTPSNVEIGDVFNVVINGTTITYTGAVASVDDVTSGLTSAINLSSESTNVTATDQSTYIEITANTPGTPFSISSSTTNRPAETQVSTVTPSNVEIGDVFNVVINGTTITYTGAVASVDDVTSGLTSAINLSSESTNVTATDQSTYIEITANTPGTPFSISSDAINRQAVSQVVSFTPNSYIIDYTVYRATIDGTNFNYEANSSDTEQNIVEGLQPLMSVGSVNCIEDDLNIICTANTPGVEFLYSSEVIDKTDLVSAINSEYSDGASRTTYILNESDYTTDSWNNYVGAINDAISVETNLDATNTDITNAISDIDAKKDELSLNSFTYNYDITSNSTNDSNLDSIVYNGIPYVVYERDGNIYFKEGVGSEELIGSGSSPTVEVNGSGAHLIYFDSGIIKYLNKTSGTWSSAQDITSTVNPTSADFKIDSDGYIHLVYSKASTESYDDLYYSTNTSGSFVENNFCHGYYWSGFGGQYCGHPVGIELDSSNYFHISYISGWRDSTPSYSTQSMAYYTNHPSGNTGSSGFSWNSSPVSTSKNNISIDSSGNINILYGAGSNRYIGKIVSGVWNETLIGSSYSNYSVDTDGTTIGILYIDSSNNLKYTQDNGAGFIGTTIISTGASNSSLSMGNGEIYSYYIKNDGVDDEVKVTSTTTIYSVPGQIDNNDGDFVSILGSIGLSNLEVGGTYTLMSGSTIVSSGTLVASDTVGNIELNPSYFTNYGYYSLTLSGSYNSVTTTSIDTVNLYIGPVDFEDLYVNQVSPALSSSGVTTNLSSVTYANVTSFQGLYFEQTGLGKIEFSGSLNLTDSGTTDFLQNLPNYLNMDNGYIELSGEELSAYPAKIYMYDFPASFSGVVFDSEDFTVKNNTGEILDGSTIMSGIETSCTGLGCDIVFDTAHFTSFDLKPFLTDTSIVSNNTYSGSLAMYGDKVILTLTGSEALTGVYVTFNGNPAESVVGGGNVWTATSQSIDSGSGEITFSIDYYDLTGNSGSTVTNTSDLSSVTIDPDIPTASIDYSTTLPTAQDVIATLTGASEDIVITNNGGLTTYTFSENGSFTFEYRDTVGNTGSTTATVTNINESIPTITLNGSGNIDVEKGTSYSELGAIWSDQTDGTGSVSTISGSVDTNTIGTYLLEYIYVNSLGLTGSTTRNVNVIDTTSPLIPTITSTDDITNLSTFTITGTGDIDEFINLYNSSGSIVGSGITDGLGEFSIDITLEEGINTIIAKSYDSSNNFSSGSNSIIIAKDTISPLITLKQIKDIKENEVTLDFDFEEDNFTLEDGNVEVYDLSDTYIGTYNITFSGSNGVTALAGLDSDTNYTYTLYLTDDAGNSTSATGSFSTAQIVSFEGDIYSTGATSFGFEGSIGEGNEYLLNGNMYIDSDPNDNESMTGTLTLSGVNIIVSSGSWNGILIPPLLIDPNDSEAASGSEIGTGVTIVQTIKTGSEGAELSATGGYFQVSFMIPGYSSGTTFTIYRSSDGSIWETNTPDSSCTLNSSLMCTFRTDHLSYFAPGLDSEPDTFTFTPLTNKELSTSYESNTITVNGTDTGSTISITGGEYKIGDGSYTSTTGTVQPLETVTVRQTSSSSYSTTTKATLTIGGVSGDFDVTTKQAPSGGGSSGGSPSLIKDDCPGGDFSESYYDKTCGTKPTQTGSTTTVSQSGSTTTSETNQGGGTTNETTQSGGGGGGGSTGGGSQSGFNDIDNSFAKEYINKLYDMGVIKGYGDGSFGPDKDITRAEFLSVVMKTYKIDLTSDNTNEFVDVPNDGVWMIPYLIKAKELGIVNGQIINGKLMFRPNDPISRAEALAILFKTSGIDLDYSSQLEFEDEDIEAWMVPYLIKAKELGIVSGQIINGKLMFRPNDPISRAESCKIIVKSLDF